MNPNTVFRQCSYCGRVVATRFMSFSKHFGMIIMMRTEDTSGHFCWRCMQVLYVENTLITLIAGWWGVISLLMTPMLVLTNTIEWISNWGLLSDSRKMQKMFRPGDYSSGCHPPHYRISNSQLSRHQEADEVIVSGVPQNLPPVETLDREVTCPKCQCEMTADRLFCPHCGYERRHRACASCGRRLKPGFKVCPYCGVAPRKPAS